MKGGGIDRPIDQPCEGKMARDRAFAKPTFAEVLGAASPQNADGTTADRMERTQAA